MTRNSPSTDTDDYYARRAEEERARAESAADPAVRNIHLELLRRYRERLSMEQAA